MPIEVPNIEAAKGVSKEFLKAYQKFEKEADENRKALKQISSEETSRALRLSDRGHERESDKAFEKANRVIGRVGENRRYFWNKILGPVAEKYGLTLSTDESVVGFNIAGVGYAEVDLANPKEIYTPKNRRVSKWHNLRHENVVEKISLTTLQ